MNTAFSCLEAAPSNPFALMTEPDAVFAAVQRSDRLNGLGGRVILLLDRPAPARPGAGGASDVEAFDRRIDATGRAA